jgi:hypothetical protein
LSVWANAGAAKTCSTVLPIWRRCSLTDSSIFSNSISSIWFRFREFRDLLYKVIYLVSFNSKLWCWSISVLNSL